MSEQPEMKVTLLECIQRIPSLIDKILDEEQAMFADLEAYLPGEADAINEVVLVGSGTSNTVSITARPFMERVSGLSVKAVYPNDLIVESAVCNPKALYVFVSQTGTSSVVCEVMEKLKGLGLLCVSFTDSPESRLAGISPCHVCINCGNEEYGMRTIGYTTSVLNLMLLGLHLGLRRGKLTKAQYDEYIQDAHKVPASLEKVIKDAEVWFEHNKRKMMRSDCIIFTGLDEFYGLALEGAVKYWEMPQVISMGYELEEGLHGPNYGYTYPHCVIVFNDGSRQPEKALALARYMKECFNNGYIVGEGTLDEDDLPIEAKSKYFHVLEYSAVHQVSAYFLTIDGGRDLMKPSGHRRMSSYFTTHSRG